MHPPLHKVAITPFATSGPTGYTPQQMRHAYGFDRLGATGAGQIIAIVDAYGSPTIQSDLNTFCAAFGIPSTTVQVYNPQGQTTTDTGWAGETSLDVEWAHAIAPDATIAVVASKSASTSDLLAAVDFAVNLGAKQISMSWGGSEFSTERNSDFHFNVPGVSFFASSGDSGAGVEYPAASPFVVSVGGTTLHLDTSNNVSSETAWSGSGGGESAYEPLPGFQSGWYTGSRRGVPDVAYDANPSTGVPVYQTSQGWGQFGGTSMSAPQWAALFALANSLRASSISSAPSTVYSLANSSYAGYFRDIVSGSNGHSAGPGYDLVTGLGSPLGDPLVLALAGGSSSSVAAPVFNPPAGTYTSAQVVTITTTTGGATIRYTIDGSTPTESHGTIYSGPVSIGSTAALKAIAYESGMTDSSVTTGTYTISTGGGGGTTVSFEAENLSYTPSGATASVQTDANSSGGHWVLLSGNSVGDNITYSIPTVAAGTYQLRMEWKGLGSRGILQLSVDGTNLGPTLDQYSSSAIYPITTFGTVTFVSAGTHTIRLTVTGKNSASSGYGLSADKFTFVAQSGGSSVSAPTFNPVGGTYSSAQNVTISTSTSGATIRYTTDGSTPSETAGTIYSGPVNIAATTTLKAIAYESGFTDSAVTSAAYTIGTTPPPTLNFEAENLSYTPSGATASVQTDANSSGGHWVMLSGNSIGDHIDYAIPSVPAGTYQLRMEWKGLGSRGILQLSVDGANLGPTLDQYSPSAIYPTTTFGTVTFAAAGAHTVRLTVTGKNSASSNYQLSADKFTFVGQ